MRPVNRGDHPLGQERRDFARHQDARPFLLERMGPYCSYCERPITHLPHVEHVQPKRRHPKLECHWDNLLLGCTNCNGIKGDGDVDLALYYWPDQHNTAALLAYAEGGLVGPRAGLGPADGDRVAKTIALTGLDRKESNTDFRRDLRREAWDVALDSRNDLRGSDCEAMRRQITRTAVGIGFFSVWMTVFREDADMRRRFIKEFRGTDPCCFEKETGQPKDAIDRPWIGDQ